MQQENVGGPAAKPPAQASTPVPNEPLQGFFPWRRFFARHLDMMLVGLLLSYSVLRLFGETSSISRFERTSDVLPYMASLLLLVPIEAALIAVCGTTVGKWLYAIRIESKDQQPLSFSNSLRRAFQVYLRGMALGIPIISLFSMGIGYRTLKDSRTTTWDREARTRALHFPLGIARILALTLLWAGIIALMTSVFWE